jgi:hypothetical protein
VGRKLGLIVGCGLVGLFVGSSVFKHVVSPKHDWPNGHSESSPLGHHTIHFDEASDQSVPQKNVRFGSEIDNGLCVGNFGGRVGYLVGRLGSNSLISHGVLK